MTLQIPEALQKQLPILVIVGPMLSAPLCLLMRRARLCWTWAMIVLWASFGAAVLILDEVVARGVISYAVGDWKPPIGIEIRIDLLNAFVLLIVTGISAVVLIGAPGSLEAECDREKHYLFYAAYLLCMTGLAGMTVTGDAFNIFVFLEISSLASYILIAQGSSPRALTSSFRYLVMGTLGGTFLLLGIGLLYMTTGTLNIADLAARLAARGPNRTVLAGLACIGVGVGIKLALFPLHVWLPNAYTYAPHIVTAFLSATATKVAFYVLVRFVFTVFTVGLAFGEMGLNAVLLPMSILAILVASTVAIFQQDIKRMLAYSSIAQIGYMVLGLSFGSVTGLTGAVVHLFNHAAIKSSLFLAVASVALRTGGTRIEHFRGLFRRMPLTMGAFLVAGLGLIGIPLTAGFVTKWYLVLAALESDHWLIAFLVLLGSLLAVIYVWRVIEPAFFREPPEGKPEIREAPPGLLIPMWILALATIYFGAVTEPTAGIAHRAAELLIRP